MSESSLQMLLHAGEVEYIIKTINAPKLQNAKFVGGCLFGLWRNSLKQPVIQFVTGPGKQFNAGTTLEEVFYNEYTRRCADYIGESHCLLHLGFWFSGTEANKEKAKNYFIHQRKYNVLLFIDVSKTTLSGEYYLQKDNMPDASSPLYKEDVLQGDSSFRLYKPLITANEIKKDAIELPKPTSGSLPDIKGLINNLPSRVKVEEALTSEEQWYSTDEGMLHLQLLFQYFNDVEIQAGMSRDAINHNIQFDLRGGYSLDFPANFPKGMPVLRSADGRKFEISRPRGEVDICKYVVEEALTQIQSLQLGRGGSKGKRYR